MNNGVVVGVFVVATGIFVGGAVVATKVSQQKPPTTTASDAQPLPALTVFRAGQPLPLYGKREKPALLHLWATWCGPCRDELPLILDFGRGGDVEVIAVSVDDDYKSVQQYFGPTSIPPEVAWDKNIVVEKAMGVNSLPTTIVLDTEGRVRGTLTGAQDWRDPGLRDAIDRVLR